MTNAKWLKGKGGTEFLQFADGRITRERFPLGGYVYTSTIIIAAAATKSTVYSGNDFQAARTSITKATTGDQT